MKCSQITLVYYVRYYYMYHGKHIDTAVLHVLIYDPKLAVMRYCVGPVWYRSAPRNACYCRIDQASLLLCSSYFQAEFCLHVFKKFQLSLGICVQRGTPLETLPGYVIAF